jgi:hypothetical protein
MWMQDGCKVNMESCLASNQLWFTVTWIVLINHLLEVSLTQNQETMAQPLIYYILLCVQTPDERNSLKIAFGWGPNNIWIHTTLEGPCPHYMTLKVSWDCLLDTFFWALTTSWSRLMACVCEVESYIMCPYPCPWVLGGHGCKIIVHGWAWVHPCIQLQIGVKLLGCREYANQEALRTEANDNERPFICLIQPRLGVGG